MHRSAGYAGRGNERSWTLIFLLLRCWMLKSVTSNLLELAKGYRRASNNHSRQLTVKKKRPNSVGRLK
jgi:hypothetical protein